ncbi:MULTISPECIES: copper chaperone PCu(A)C [unclassified Thioalkalivibrio]|uniref:copper chaperone PCu(A)C n=1 Tax=unclassified Thioalkalivibrio TaxID=2621013 RepID=UPI0003A22E32|nr:MULTISPECIES: copper chaperone PCu(A)C [unclassified Thioalkalivibrio]
MKGSTLIPAVMLTTTLLAGGAVAPALAGEPEVCECRAGLEMEGTPWIRLMPGDMTGGYFVLRNHGEQDLRIVAAQAPISEVVELHEHAHVDGVMRMRQVNGLELPAGETLVLEPGGLHLMFIGLHEPLTAGDWIPVILEFEDGGTMEIHARVQRGEGAHGGHSGGHMMEGDAPGMDAEGGHHGH